MEPKKANHQTLIVRLGAARIHGNADSLELFDIPDTGYQIVSKKGQFKEGDLAVYVQPDSVVPETAPFEFIWGPYKTGGDAEGHAVPDRRRRITVRKFRKEWSEGLLMPLSDFPEFSATYPYLGAAGDDVSDILGITHWESDSVENTKGDAEHAPKRKSRWPKSLKGWFYFILFKLGINLNGDIQGWDREKGLDVSAYDVEALKNFKYALIPGESVIITEKIHGSQARYVYLDGHMYAGSRNLWKAPNSTCIWRKVLAQNLGIEEWCKLNEGAVLYGEVVPTQKGYKYGCEEGETKFFAFDVKDSEGNFLPKIPVFGSLRDYANINSVPVLYFGEWQASLINRFAEGATQVAGVKGVREGVVITSTDPTRYVRGLGRVQLKLVSNSFLEKDKEQ